MMSDDNQDEDLLPEEDFSDQDATVTCPHCGEEVVITIDPGGGVEQEYIEDCEVCCRPWRVTLHYGDDGRASVELEPG